MEGHWCVGLSEGSEDQRSPHRYVAGRRAEFSSRGPMGPVSGFGAHARRQDGGDDRPGAPVAGPPRARTSLAVLEEAEWVIGAVLALAFWAETGGPAFYWPGGINPD